MPLKIEWPNFTNQAERHAWYAKAIVECLQAWDEDASEAQFTPCTDAILKTLEQQLGCVLPPALRDYHLNFGVSGLAETINKPDIDDDYGIKPLLDAYPGIVDMGLSKEELDLAAQLVAFGDYLGNGNMWCFHRDNHKVYYFDHDTAPRLTPIFDDVQDYLDAVMVLGIAEAEDADEEAEAVLSKRFGDKALRKWRY